MLMHAGILDDQCIPRLPIEAAPIMDIVTLPFQDIEDRAVHMAVALAVAAGRETIDMRLDGLRHLRRAWIDHLLAEILWSAFPFQIFGVVHARLGEELMHQFAIGAFKGAHESSFLGPAFPDRLFRAA